VEYKLASQRTSCTLASLKNTLLSFISPLICDEVTQDEVASDEVIGGAVTRIN
jgi:hypothetical protein